MHQLQPKTIVKVGGSLLSNSNLKTIVQQLKIRLTKLVQKPKDKGSDASRRWKTETGSQSAESIRSSDRPNFILPTSHWIIGGGAVVDGIRNWNAHLALGESLCHKLAIQAMGISAKAFSEVSGIPLPNSEMSRMAEMKKDVVVDFEDWWISEPEIVKEIPESWEVSSDSLALCYALSKRASHLVLVKSVAPLEEGIDLDKMTRLGWIDGYFRVLWRSISHQICLAVVHATTEGTPILWVEN